MLQRWNLAAAVGTHALCILGAFITRSGVLASVHAFGRSRVGPLLLAYLVGILLLAGVLLARRWTALRPARRLESVLSRDAGLLATNLTLVGLLLAVLGGTLHPLVSELVTGTAVEAGPPYFDRMASRLGLPLLGLIGVCAQLDWRRTTPAVAGWRLALPAAAGLVGAALLVAAGVRHGSVLLCVALAAFAATGLVRAAWLYTSAALGAAGPSRLASLSYLVCARRRRSGAWLAHVAVVVLCAGFCGNVFTVGQELLLRRGESAAIAAYRLTLVTLAGREEADRAVTAAAVALHLSSGGTGRSSAQQSLSEGPGAGRFVGSLLPARHYYPSSDQGTTEVAICSALWEDLYLALLGFAEDGSSARFQVLYLPLVRLVWIGGLLCILAALWSLWPGYRRQRCTSGAGRSESSAQDRGRPASTGERGTAGPGAVASRPAGCGSS